MKETRKYCHNNFLFFNYFYLKQKLIWRKRTQKMKNKPGQEKRGRFHPF